MTLADPDVAVRKKQAETATSIGSGALRARIAHHFQQICHRILVE
jgi:hypothetical protein